MLSSVDHHHTTTTTTHSNTTTTTTAQQQQQDTPKMTRTRTEDPVRKTMVIGGVVTLYWFVSITMVFLNKYLLSSESVKLEAPIFITWFQCVVAVVVCWLLGVLSPYLPDTPATNFPAFHVDPVIVKQSLPLSIFFVGMIAFNNLCLKYVGVSFYNVGRSLTTVFNVAFTYFCMGQSTSSKALLTCAIIVLGFFLGVDQVSVHSSVLSAFLFIAPLTLTLTHSLKRKTTLVI